MRNLACLQHLLPGNLEASGKRSALRLQVSTLYDFDSDFDSDFDLDDRNNVGQFIPF
jgi:hypothetical protein